VDLRSTLQPGDVFVSYWLDDGIVSLVGDATEIHAADTRPAPGLSELLTTFEAQVTRPDEYVRFIKPEYRSLQALTPVASPPSMPDLLDRLASLVVPRALATRAVGTNCRRLIVFPDGALHLLPIHLLVERAAAHPWRDAFPGGIVYAPSASAYAYACAKRRLDAPRRAVVVVGDASDEALVREAQTVAKHMPCPASIIHRTSELEQTAEADILYIATHGESGSSLRAAAGRPSGAGWSLEFDSGALSAEDFFGKRMKLAPGSVVVLSACSVGHVMAGAVHELDGLIQAVFYAGAATILAARWPIFYEAAEEVFVDTIEQAFGGKVTFAAALAWALDQAATRGHARELMASPEAATFFWGPFALFGCGD
jgi:hypothetical protein